MSKHRNTATPRHTAYTSHRNTQREQHHLALIINNIIYSHEYMGESNLCTCGTQILTQKMFEWHLVKETLKVATP